MDDGLFCMRAMLEETIEAVTSVENDLENGAKAQIVELLKNLSQTEIDAINQADGVIAWAGDSIFEYVAKDANQIKSATENIGTFDSANDDIRYSLNRDNANEVADNVLPVTPELEAEANEELARDGENVSTEVEDICALFEEKIKKSQHKRFTFDSIKDFISQEQVREGLQGATKSQYNAILKDVIETLEDEENQRESVSKAELLWAINLALTNARLKVAQSNLKIVGKDFKNNIRKKREGKNTRGEVIQKGVSDEVRQIMQEFIATIAPLFSHTDGVKAVTEFEKMLLAGTIVKDEHGKEYNPIENKMAEYEQEAIDGGAKAKGIVALLEMFGNVRRIAQEIEALKSGNTEDLLKKKDLIKEDLDLEQLKKSIAIIESGQKGWGNSWRAIKHRGFNTIEEAKNKVTELESTAKARENELNRLNENLHNYTLIK